MALEFKLAALPNAIVGMKRVGRFLFEKEAPACQSCDTNTEDGTPEQTQKQARWVPKGIESLL